MRRSLCFRHALALGALLLLGGCLADMAAKLEAAKLPQVSVDLGPIPDPAPEWTLAQDVNVYLREGFEARLKAGTTWRQVGRIAQGDVFHSGDAKLVIAYVYLADAVIKADVVVGFYLPSKHTFTPADPEIQIKRLIRSP